MTGDRAEREAKVRAILQRNGVRTKPGRSYTYAGDTSPEMSREDLQRLRWETSVYVEKYRDPAASRLAQKLTERLTELIDEA